MAAHRRVEPWRAGLAVRRDWPDGTHEFVEFSLTAAVVERFLSTDRTYWRRSYYRPTLSVVSISRRDFELHRLRRLCRAPDCPVRVASSAADVA